MLVLTAVEGTTLRGRQWRTQIGIEVNENANALYRDDSIRKQLSDYREQLEYERSQLL